VPFQAAITIAKALESIHRRDFLLPAIQREFRGATIVELSGRAVECRQARPHCQLRAASVSRRFSGIRHVLGAGEPSLAGRCIVSRQKARRLLAPP
jgi:hypothetical protein